MPHVGFYSALEKPAATSQQHRNKKLAFLQQPILAPPLSLRRRRRHWGDTRIIAAPLTSSRSHVHNRGATHTSLGRYGLHRGARHGAPKTFSSPLRDLRHHGTTHVIKSHPRFPSRRHLYHCGTNPHQCVSNIKWSGLHLHNATNNTMPNINAQTNVTVKTIIATMQSRRHSSIHDLETRLRGLSQRQRQSKTIS